MMLEQLIPRALLDAQNGDFEAAQQELFLAHSIAQSADLFHIQAALGAHIARLQIRMALQQNNLAPLEQVAAWVRQTQLTHTWQQDRTYIPFMLHHGEFEALTYARYLLLIGDIAKVKEITAWAKARFESRGAHFLTFETDLLTCLTTSDQAQAQQAFKAALDKVKHQNAPRLLLDFDAQLGSRISELTRGMELDDWTQELIAGFEGHQQSFPVPTSEDRDVLQHMAKGMKHEEIASRRNEPKETTRSLIHRIYAMLGVKQRSDALTKARRLGWI
jgi:DNA-binding CsgD family transcriptional regulator